MDSRGTENVPKTVAQTQVRLWTQAILTNNKFMSSSSTAHSTLSLRKRQPAKLANLPATSKLCPLMSSSTGRMTRSRCKRQQAFDSQPAVKPTYPLRPKAAPTGKTARYLSIISNEISNSSPLDQSLSSRIYDECETDWNSERQVITLPTNLTTTTSDEISVIMNEINSISSNDWDVLDDIVHESFGGMEAIDLSVEFTIGAHLECEDLNNCLRRARISTRTVTPHDKKTPLLHTPLEQQIDEELDDANIRLREACKLSEKESEHNREASSLKKHYELEAKLSLVFPEKQLDDVSEQLQQANKLLEEYHELRNQESEDNQSTSSLKRQCDELEAKLSSVTEQLQQAKKLVEEHEQKTYSLKKQCDEVKAKLSSVILDPKTCKRENKSSSNTAFAEDEISFLRAAQEKADGYNGYRHDMSNAKSYEFISTECDLAKVDKQVQDLRELVNEKKMKLKECRERCKNRHQPWPP